MASFASLRRAVVGLRAAGLIAAGSAPPSLREALVHARLRKVLRHSLQSVPAVQLKLAGFVNARALPLKDFPPTTRADLRNLPSVAHLSTLAAGVTTSDATSGSSGERLTVVRDELDTAIGDAIWMRTYAQLGWNPGMRRARLRHPDPETDHQPMRGLRARLHLPQPVEISSALPPEAQVNALLRYCPDLIHGSPFELAQVCSELKRCRMRLAPRAVVCAGEPLHADVAALIRDRLGVAPRSVYGTSEAGLVAWSCRRGRFHVNSDVVFVELQSDGRDGRANVLMTTLLRRAMPLIRFAPDDVVLSPDQAMRCGCGSAWPLFGEPLGPESSFLQLPDGTRVAERDVAAALASFGGSHRFALTQTDSQRVNVCAQAQVVASNRKRRAVRHALHRLVGGELSFSIEPVTNVPRGKTGKYALVRRTCGGFQ